MKIKGFVCSFMMTKSTGSTIRMLMEISKINITQFIINWRWSTEKKRSWGLNCTQDSRSKTGDKNSIKFWRRNSILNVRSTRKRWQIWQETLKVVKNSLADWRTVLPRIRKYWSLKGLILTRRRLSLKTKSISLKFKTKNWCKQSSN